MHIALLDVDAPVPAVYRTRGLYSSQFRHLLKCAADRLHHPVASSFHTTAFDVVGGNLPPLESLLTISATPNNEQNEAPNPLARPIDAILITGSGAAAYDSDGHAWIAPLQSFIRTVYDNFPHVKLFGSCFGHQIIAQALLSPAVRVERAVPHNGGEMGLFSVNLSQEFVERFAVLKTLSPPCLRLQMVHGDWVIPATGKTLPEGWMNIGSSERCPVQGLYKPGRVLTYQGHFEFDVFVTRETIIEFGRRLGWDEGVVKGYLETTEKGREGCAEGQEDNDESKVAAEVVLLFFAEKDC